jgi:outer membrane receptor for ferrienterochelin and colicins
MWLPTAAHLVPNILKLKSVSLVLLSVGLLFFLAGVAPGRADSDVPPSAPSGSQDFTALSLEQLANVKITSASLHEESPRDAPASVTVITAEEISKFGYRTLAEALSYVRGFFITSDHTYSYVGMRGMSLPGDYDTRMLLMINGHNTAENVDLSTWFGEDFPLDLNLVERIEVVRGPTSALYGSSGMLGTINVITKRPDQVAGAEVRMETGAGERKIGAAASLALGAGAKLLLSTSIFNSPGAGQLYFSELDSPSTNFGRALNMDAQKGYHFFADFTWGNWDALVVDGDRVKIQPISWGNTIFNDRGTRAEDSRGFFELSYTRDFGAERTFSWRTSYDDYRYRGIYRYSGDDGGVQDNREHIYGDWLSSKITYRLPDSNTGHLTVGADFQIDLRALQNVFDVQPQQQQILWINRPDRYVGFFAQQEWSLGRHWELNLGGRFDWSWLKPGSLSPRAAIIFKPASRANIKLLYGRGFRNPSSYEMFYNDDGLTETSNLSLRPETSDTYELDGEYEFTRRLRAVATVYTYRMNNLIQQIYTPAGLEQFVNADHVNSSGTSLELDYVLPRGIEISSSLEIQRSVFGEGNVLPNSPGQVGKLHVSVPLWRGRLNLGAGLQALGQRQTYAGVTLPWYIQPEVVVRAKQLPCGLELSAGIKNLSNTFYRDPAGLSSTIDSMIGDGRSYYLNLIWRSPEKQSSPAPKGSQTQAVGRQVQAGLPPIGSNLAF